MNSNVKARVKFLENIISKMPGLIYSKNLNGAYLICNDAQAKIIGLNSAIDVIGKTDFELLEREQANKLREVDNVVIDKGVPLYSFEEELTLPDGRVATFLSTKQPLYDDFGKIIGLLGFSVDITDRKKAERLREEKEILEKQLESATLLGASIAHELRTPLVGIGGYAKIFKKFINALISGYRLQKIDTNVSIDIDDEYLEEVGDGVESIEKEIEASHTFINMLLMNITSQRISDTSFQIYSIDECVTKALSRYPFKGQQKKIIFYENIDDFKFKGSHQLIVHVLFNLLKNALFFIRRAKKGEVYITLNLQNSQYNQLIFRDTGTGIPPEQLPYVFERFKSYRDDGAGVGLTFCKRVMEAHGGDIVCRSELGEFTEFILTFPRIE